MPVSLRTGTGHRFTRNCLICRGEAADSLGSGLWGRRAVKAFVEGDPLLRRYFTAFLFEDLAAGDRRADRRVSGRAFRGGRHVSLCPQSCFDCVRKSCYFF